MQGKQDSGDGFTGVCLSLNSSNCVHKMFISLCINDTSKNLFKKKETLKDGFTLWYSHRKNLEIIEIDNITFFFLPVCLGSITMVFSLDFAGGSKNCKEQNKKECVLRGSIR